MPRFTVFRACERGTHSLHRAHHTTIWETGMLKAALVGALALTMVESFSITQHGFGITPAAAEEIVVTEGQIGRLHAALHLTAAQERHWYPVAAILRTLG